MTGVGNGGTIDPGAPPLYPCVAPTDSDSPLNDVINRQSDTTRVVMTRRVISEFRMENNSLTANHN